MFNHPESLPLLLDNVCRKQDTELLAEIWSELAYYAETNTVKKILAIAKTCLSEEQISWLERSLLALA